MVNALDKVMSPPNWKTTAKLETLIQTMFAVTQGQVHIISGRLKLSGRTKTDLDRHTWTGEIMYGGPSGSPAYYGVYELYRKGVRPGWGPHDYFTGLEAFDPAFEKAIDWHFRPMQGKA